MTVAHFTLTELPGTLAILLAGVALGMTMAAQRLKLGALVLTGFIAYALVSLYGDTAGISTEVKTSIDALAGASALTLAVGYYRQHHRAR